MPLLQSIIAAYCTNLYRRDVLVPLETPHSRLAIFLWTGAWSED